MFTTRKWCHSLVRERERELKPNVLVTVQVKHLKVTFVLQHSMSNKSMTGCLQAVVTQTVQCSYNAECVVNQIKASSFLQNTLVGRSPGDFPRWFNWNGPSGQTTWNPCTCLHVFLLWNILELSCMTSFWTNKHHIIHLCSVSSPIVFSSS